MTRRQAWWGGQSWAGGLGGFTIAGSFPDNLWPLSLLFAAIGVWLWIACWRGWKDAGRADKAQKSTFGISHDPNTGVTLTLRRGTGKIEVVSEFGGAGGGSGRKAAGEWPGYGT